MFYNIFEKKNYIYKNYTHCAFFLFVLLHEKIFFDNHRQADQSEGDKKQENITADVFTNCVNKTNKTARRFEDLIAALWTK